jgi:hypothetical protein
MACLVETSVNVKLVNANLSRRSTRQEATGWLGIGPNAVPSVMEKEECELVQWCAKIHRPVRPWTTTTVLPLPLSTIKLVHFLVMKRIALSSFLIGLWVIGQRVQKLVVEVFKFALLIVPMQPRKLKSKKVSALHRNLL